MICERCQNPHNGDYGSGRFCNSKCARGFSTSHNRELINRLVSWRAKQQNWKPRGLLPLSPEAMARRIASFKRNHDNKPWEQLGKSRRKAILLREQGGRCLGCGLIPEWQGKPLVLEIDHINGNHCDNRKENMRVLCPNCHSQTPTFRNTLVSRELRRRINDGLEDGFGKSSR